MSRCRPRIDGAHARACRARRRDPLLEIRAVPLLPPVGTVREAAHARGIRIIGDVPIYVAGDSADVWANQRALPARRARTADLRRRRAARLLQRHRPALGQSALSLGRDARAAIRWWIARVRTNLRLADVVRLDHFRGFAAYWEIPADEATAVHGRWMPGPGWRCSTHCAKARRPAAHRRRPRLHHAGRARPATRDRSARHEDPAVRLRAATARTCRIASSRTPSSTPARTTTTPRAAGSQTRRRKNARPRSRTSDAPMRMTSRRVSSASRIPPSRSWPSSRCRTSCRSAAKRV
jgi:hypothetical protein